MTNNSSSECSTDFEASNSVVSAADSVAAASEEQDYTDDDFEASIAVSEEKLYDDVFEASASVASAADSTAAALSEEQPYDEDTFEASASVDSAVLASEEQQYTDDEFEASPSVVSVAATSAASDEQPYSDDVFETSTFVVSAADSIAAASEEQQYAEDDFDDYSDSFESDNDAVEPEMPTPAASSSTGLNLLTRVQVFWEEEKKWFDGAIRRIEEGNEPRYLVHYDDGEQQWESPANIRPLPPSITVTAHYDQLQQLLPLSAQGARALVDRRAIVYWSDEREWYHGIVSAAQTSPAALKIEYDDSDSRWEQEHVFNCILLLQEALQAPLLPTFGSESHAAASLTPPERVLYARPYIQVVKDHFEPVRIARPYRCVVEKHSEIVIIPRRYYSERQYFQTVDECRESSGYNYQVEKVAQTILSSSVTKS